jgi:ESCRT-II complex subunit VPS36
VPYTCRTSTGARFHLELARQLADFLLAGPLKNAGGLLPLADVYCLFNRARGTELVSPEDLLTAVKLFEKVGGGAHGQQGESSVWLAKASMLLIGCQTHQLLQAHQQLSHR